MNAKQERSAETRAALLLAARRVFAAKGYRHASIADIVAAAGRARGTFYLYFADRDAIFAALVEEVTAEMVAQARVIWNREHPARSIQQSVRVFLDDFAANADLWRIFDEVTATDREQAHLRTRWQEHFAGRVRRGITTVRGRHRDSLDDQIVAGLLAGMLDETARDVTFNAEADANLDEVALHMATVWSRILGYPTDELATVP